MRLPPACLFLAMALGAAACIRKDADSPAAGVAPGGSVVSGPRMINILCGDTMKYSVPEIDAAAGEELKVVLTSNSSQPREAMAHNFVLLDKDADLGDFIQTAATAKADGYLPTALMGEVIAHSKLLGSGQSDEVDFKAPAVPGEYPYFCTFPGHYLTGMHGTLVVKAPAGATPAAAPTAH
jgi:azurin